MSNALEIDQLQYITRDSWTFKKKELLAPFSLAVAEGEAFGFLGHNGAGKTTTIKCILSFLKPTAGSVRIFGVDNNERQSRAAVGYLSEQPYFYDYLTVHETLTLFANLSGLKDNETQRKVLEAAEQVGISARLNQRMRSLSKGLTQRVGLAQALIHSPKLLILDEPFSGLDPIGRREFRDIFSDIKKNGTSLFMSSHVLPDVEFLCDRVSILAHGKLQGVFSLNNLPTSATVSFELVLEGDRSTLRAQFAALATTIKEDREGIRLVFNSEQEAEHQLQKALSAGYKIVRYSRERGNLEQLFESLVSFKEGGVGKK